VLELVGDFERFIRAQTRYTVGGVLGPADQIETAQFLTNDRAPEARAIPRNPDHVRWLWSAIEQAQGPGRTREVVDSRLERGLVSVFLKNANFVDTARLMEALRDYERAKLAPRHIRFDFAGDVAVSQTLIRAIVRSQVGSLLVSALGILLVTSLLFRSLRWGLICMVPAGLAVTVTFAMMGWTGMPLGVATSMFASMVLGIGVDFAIHLVERYRVTAPQAPNRHAAIIESLIATGPAVVINALAVALGFGILVLSQVPANAQLGAITVVSLLSCLAATLLVIPALIGVTERGRTEASSRW
jgi:predicted RND superfamily exporter protein